MKRQRLVVQIGHVHYAINARDAIQLLDIASRAQTLRRTPDYRAFELAAKDEQEPFVTSTEIATVNIPEPRITVTDLTPKT
jgi:hypothetical protein